MARPDEHRRSLETQRLKPFEGRSAVLTGAASGLGRGLAEALARQGARVVVSDRDGGGAERVAGELIGRGLTAHPVTCDVTSPSQVQHLFDQAESLYGPVDYSFANAGFAMAGLAHELTTEHFQELLEVDLIGVIRCCQTVYPRMVARGRGHLVNTASLAGLVGFPGLLPYSTAKAAVVRYSLDLRVEASHYGVKVSALCPAFLQTRIFQACRTVNMDLGKVEGSVRVEALEPAVRALLRGVARNRAVVTYPWYSDLAWWVHRLSQRLAYPMSRFVFGRVRSNHRPDSRR